MAIAFISYSRTDQAFVGRLREALIDHWDTWVDSEDIRELAEWRPQIEQAIDAAEIFIFVLSPSSLASTFCQEELSYAIRNNKKLVPLELHAIGGIPIRADLADLAWVDFKSSDFEVGVDRLVGVLNTDLDWVRVHTRLQVRAKEWDGRGREGSLLMRGKDLSAVERELVAFTDTAPETNDLQAEFVLQSRASARRRQRAAYGSLLAIAAMIVGGAAWVALRTPSWSWMPTDLDVGVADVVSVGGGATERFRTRDGYVDRSPGTGVAEIGGIAYTVVLELDVTGRKLGCFAYATVDYTLLGTRPGPCEGHGGGGTLMRQWSVRSSGSPRPVGSPDLAGSRGAAGLPDPAADEERPELELWPFFLVGGAKAVSLDGLQPREHRWAGVEVFPEAAVRALTRARQVAERASPRVRLFALSPVDLLAFVEITADSSWNGYGALTLRSSDGGETWESRTEITDDLSPPGVREVAVGSDDMRILYLASADTTAPETPDGARGGVFRSDDGGLSWVRVVLADPWEGWTSFSSISAGRDGSGSLVVIGRPTDPTQGVSAIISTPDGTDWTALETGLPAPLQVALRSATLASEGRILALADGELVIWRRLGILERIQGRYGISVGGQPPPTR